MNRFNHYIIEGIDNIGKGTLINKLQNEHGYFHYVHYEKPKTLDMYKEMKNPEKEYQRESFEEGFKLLCGESKTIFDRFHLGEVVYSPLYRNYLGDYVYDMEKTIQANTLFDTVLILLYTTNYGILKDDGKSFNVQNQKKEQSAFIDAWRKSTFQNKIGVNVYNPSTHTFKTPQDIYNEISYFLTRD